MLSCPTRDNSKYMHLQGRKPLPDYNYAPAFKKPEIIQIFSFSHRKRKVRNCSNTVINVQQIDNFQFLLEVSNLKYHLSFYIPELHGSLQ